MSTLRATSPNSEKERPNDPAARTKRAHRRHQPAPKGVQTPPVGRPDIDAFEAVMTREQCGLGLPAAAEDDPLADRRDG
ncbi:MAG: hypothetical protein ACYSUI_25845 [Planctomycetota bacterium]